jgi:hypothetical protein
MRRSLWLLPLALAAAVSCYKDRVRFDVPKLEIVPDAASVAPNDTLTGVLRASDQSGLVVLRMSVITQLDTAASETDTLNARFDVPEVHDIDVPFRFPIGNVPSGTIAIVIASVLDDQDFLVQVTDTVDVIAP